MFSTISKLASHLVRKTQAPSGEWMDGDPGFNTKGATIQYPSVGGAEFLLWANYYLFQLGSVARWKFHISLHVYKEQFLK